MRFWRRNSIRIVFMKTTLGSSFLTLLHVSRYTSSDARCWMLAKKDEIPYRYPVSRNQNPVSLPNESQTSLYGDEAVKPKNIILRAIRRWYWAFVIKYWYYCPSHYICNFFADRGLLVLCFFAQNTCKIKNDMLCTRDVIGNGETLK